MMSTFFVKFIYQDKETSLPVRKNQIAGKLNIKKTSTNIPDFLDK